MLCTSERCTETEHICCCGSSAAMELSGSFRSGAAARQRMEISAFTILLLVLCATVLSLPGVRKLRPGILLACGVPRKRSLTNVNTRTPRAELKPSMRVGRRPANRLYPAEMSDRINVLQPQQTENQLAQSLNKVHCIKAIHRKRKWRWRCRHKQTAIENFCLVVCDNLCVEANGHLLRSQSTRRYQL